MVEDFIWWLSVQLLFYLLHPRALLFLLSPYSPESWPYCALLKYLLRLCPATKLITDNHSVLLLLSQYLPLIESRQCLVLIYSWPNSVLRQSWQYSVRTILDTISLLKNLSWKNCFLGQFWLCLHTFLTNPRPDTISTWFSPGTFLTTSFTNTFLTKHFILGQSWQTLS